MLICNHLFEEKKIHYPKDLGILPVCVQMNSFNHYMEKKSQTEIGAEICSCYCHQHAGAWDKLFLTHLLLAFALSGWDTEQAS